MRKSNGIVKTLMINRIPLVDKILKKIWVALAILIILAAVTSSIFRSLTPWATQYKGEVEQHLTSLLGQPVTIQSMETGWYWFQPVLKLKQITIHDGKNPSLHLEKLLAGINIFKSLWHWSIQPGVLYIDNIHLTFRQKEGRWHIDGISADALDNSEMNPEKAQQILVWLSQQERLIIKQVDAHFHFSDGGLIPVSSLNVSIVNSGGYYKLKGEAKLDQTNSTFFQLLGQVQFDPYHFEETKGQIYFSARHVAPAQWQSFFPATNLRLEGGKGNIDLWVDLDKGAVSLVQAQVNLKRLAWRLLNTKKSELIQSFVANMSWKPNDKGWQFNADHIKLRAAGVNWPENQLLVQWNKRQNSYQLFVKSVLIASLLSDAVNWPDEIQSILQIKPHGTLSDAQVLIQDNTVQYILTRFDHLGWDGKDTLPQVENLSGVLHWQPEEGRLELDSENTSVTVKGYPTQNLALLNGAADWKQLAEGLRVSIERFVLSKPDLTISAQGAVDQVSSQSIGHVRLNVDFSAKDIQQWMAYLPKDKMKAKLYAWLNNDVKRIAEASGKITINGMAKDFPFDSNNGEFSIISHASGGEILITPKWQLVKDLEGYIRLKNRNLEIDLVNGDFQGVPVKQMNMRIDDIGKDKETLLIHGMVQGQAQKMMNFVMASPLQQKLSALKMLAMKGLLSLDLRLEIPLYPENDDDLARGDLTFDKNTVLVTHKVGSVTLEDISGHLSFDEKGVTQSAITATALGYPVNITIQSVKEPQPLTTLSINGECSVDSLKSRFNLPLFQVMKGVFSVQALFKLTDDPNDLDNVSIKSSLEGLAINLPAPFGKPFNTKAPLDLSLDFNPKKAIRIRSRYNERVSSDLLFKESKGAFDFHSGQIRLGSTNAVNQKIPGLEIIGALDGFDVQQWKKVFTQFSGQSSHFILLNKLRIIDLKLNKLSLFKQNFDQMKVKAKILPDNSWALNLNQKNISGDLTYYPATNALNGFIKKLHLATLDKGTVADEDLSSSVTPDQIPNLNLRIDNLSVGTRHIGNMTLKSQSNAQRWLIDYCRIDAPFYQFNINGEWAHKDKADTTKMQIKLHLKDLAKTLELWQITPAVDAGKGDMQFNGGWNGSLFNFSLKAVSGNMYLQLKSGRITHLSPETEEKLGLGKLLSILSLQTIPRRLKLDFSDLSHDGYSFDIFKGNFSVKRGIMNTQDSYIDGPVAYASMKGNLDLVRHLYDLDLKISPHITASLPVVATIAGGPLAGIAAWVANKIINQSMQKITAYSYKISGPWNQPIVQQLSMVKKVIKKR
ncbi:transmembrane protein [Legionella shakespearei DSM 23087]|uniref:Transmembrane protein n=2 Tax=Legionella shakespearei TaxID=45075 RepID=A0A0W0YR99_9GAMM|nr:YhdP family protein [Legionella shakespearei]KTD59030.1 transmembrane protein [Legionella shakespearei DSM 23087]